MSDAPEKPDYRPTVFLPKTDFPMKAGLPQKEPAILARWQSEDLYGQVRESRAGREKFILHDGPPYANGDIHIGHTLNKVLKDMVVRTQTLLGKDAPYVPGWDCHGLPIEWKIEEQYRKKKLNKDEVPIKEFRAECRTYAAHWVDVQRGQFQRLGITGQWDKPYLTMNFNAEATIVAELMKFAESGQLYRGAKPVMWSPVEKTALAEAEIEYEDIVSTQIDVAFEIVESPIAELVGAHAVVWTTTPWTIPVNQAIAYGPAETYYLFKANDGRDYLLAFDLVDEFRTRTGLYWREDSNVPDPSDLKATLEHVASISYGGSDLAGTVARHPIYNFLRHSRESGNPASSSEPSQEQRDSRFRGSDAEWERALAFFAKPRPFLPGDFVTTDQGTGLVHMSPDHGEDDFDLCKANGIDPVFAVEGDGKYRADWAWLGGQGSVINPKFNAPDGPICSDLREAGALLAASADFQHSYPHSWRSKAKVIYRCTPQWFIGMDRQLNPLPFRGEEGAAQAAEGEGESSGSQTLAPSPGLSPEGERGNTLRSLALQAIADTRFVPEKGRNRIGSMVEGRPDWVISRQRAWGVPIALFVDRKSGRPLVDPEVNQRILAAIREQGVDAWSTENAATFLGNRDPDGFEMVTDILDVWFDSGCTHVFTLESDTWPDQSWPADLYLEGSDQHRGWFQSSLLESCGTRGRAPFKAVLTHGFTMDSKGMKMSKSLGNTINPLDLIRDSGADILRLWALSVDSSEDHRIGKEILAGVSDQYRKLRNTFRYLLGALEGFSDDEKVAPEAMPELERYMLSLLADLDAKLRRCVDDFDFPTYTRLIADFANNDLSAFYFDIRKDCLYCEVNPQSGFQTDKRRAYRTVLDALFHALVRWCAPVLVFTAEEVWGTRYPEEGSIHLREWPHIDRAWSNQDLSDRWLDVKMLRTVANEAIEPLRREKLIGSSLEAEVHVTGDKIFEMRSEEINLAEVLITSAVAVSSPSNDRGSTAIALNVQVTKTDNSKCGRCWRYLPEVPEDGDLCGRCEDVLNG